MIISWHLIICFIFIILISDEYDVFAGRMRDVLFRTLNLFKCIVRKAGYFKGIHQYTLLSVIVLEVVLSFPFRDKDIVRVNSCILTLDRCPDRVFPDNIKDVHCMIEAVLFDLDGTLLEIEIDRLLPPYIQLLAAELADYIPPDTFGDELMTAVAEMIGNTDHHHTNERVFWMAMERHTGVTADIVGELIERFYKEKFPTLKHVARRVDIANDVVQEIAQNVKTVVLATNPIFPEVAIRERLTWAGVNSDHFSLITSYEKMHACKPNSEYYREICALVGIRPENCLMVGNDYDMDIVPAAAIGMHTYLVDDVTPPGKTEEAFAAFDKTDDTDRSGRPDRARHGRGPLKEVVSFTGFVDHDAVREDP